MSKILGIDLGTSSLKSMLISENGNMAALSARAYQFASPRNGFAEHNPEEWWQACAETVKEVLLKSAVQKDEIKEEFDTFLKEKIGKRFIDKARK